MKSKRELYDDVKKATVAVTIELTDRLPKRPFTTIGSGFCVHSEGVIVTCAHVFRAFFEPEALNAILENLPDDGSPRPIAPEGVRQPTVMFNLGTERTQVIFPQVGVTNAVMHKSHDLAVFKLSKHAAFPHGYPTIPIAKYEDLHEMMEIATCGFPLGDALNDQFGTVSSSFTQGRISSIIPVAGVSAEHLKGFQLDLTATNGNSGGPVFSLETGEVFGVLTGGATHPATGHVVQGLTIAEPIYPLIASGLFDRIRSEAHRPSGL